MEFLSPVILIIRFLCSDIIKNFWSKSWARALQKNLQLKKSPRSPKMWVFFSALPCDPEWHGKPHSCPLKGNGLRKFATSGIWEVLISKTDICERSGRRTLVGALVRCLLFWGCENKARYSCWVPVIRITKWLSFPWLQWCCPTGFLRAVSFSRL